MDNNDECNGIWEVSRYTRRIKSSRSNQVSKWKAYRGNYSTRNIPADPLPKPRVPFTHDYVEPLQPSGHSRRESAMILFPQSCHAAGGSSVSVPHAHPQDYRYRQTMNSILARSFLLTGFIKTMSLLFSFLFFFLFSPHQRLVVAPLGPLFTVNTRTSHVSGSKEVCFPTRMGVLLVMCGANSPMCSCGR